MDVGLRKGGFRNQRCAAAVPERTKLGKSCVFLKRTAADLVKNLEDLGEYHQHHSPSSINVPPAGRLMGA